METPKKFEFIDESLASVNKLSMTHLLSHPGPYKVVALMFQVADLATCVSLHLDL